MGVDGAHNIVGKMSVPTTLHGKVVGCRPVGVQGMVLGIVFDLSALPYFLCPFPGPHRAGIPGRLVLVGSDCASRRRAISKGSMHPRLETRVEVQKRCLARPSGWRGRPESEVSIVPPWPGLSVGEAGRSRKRALIVLSKAFRSEIGSSFWSVV